MTHPVDGFDLKFTSRTSWKAERRCRGKLVDIVPVTWTKGRRQDPDTKNVYQEVWFQDHNEMDERNNSREPFPVAVAIAKDYSKFPHAFDQFRAIFEVVSTGNILSEKSIETKVLRRLKAD
jgi:hypothetical protein